MATNSGKLKVQIIIFRPPAIILHLTGRRVNLGKAQGLIREAGSLKGYEARSVVRSKTYTLD
jgi:hypothetical protein